MGSTVAAPAFVGDCHVITGAGADYDALVELVGDRRFVLIGEASHGTHEFYRERARITRRLIDECGFTAVAVEADWPDAYRVNRYVMGLSQDKDADAALSDFRRFPAWMWRNHDVEAFVQWLRERNDAHMASAAKVRFYGLDLYSLRASIEAVVGYLDHVDPDEAMRARERYSCFDQVGGEGQAYGYGLATARRYPVRERGRHSIGRAASAGRRVSPPRRLDCRRRVLLRRAECTARAQRRGVLPADVSGRGVVMESSRSTYGGNARCTCRAPRRPSSPSQDRRVGAQLTRG